MTNAFDTYTRQLAGDPELEPTPAVVLAWLERELADEGAAWVVSDITDEFCGFRDDSREEAAQVVLKALAATEPQAVVWYSLADALRRLVKRDAARKADSLRLFDDMMRPLRESIEHFDAISADRRSLASTMARMRP